ncbi:sphingosine/diacylglycerol kinase-like enzyme [Caulobacter sp. AP07]|uniref:diacylglycerol/lipid kinase family protein n=1 Tax=Caulobacter sp. AP07 TaxID=1144304 RepID=UPI000271EE02|nr:diacylglycerol kinase family protein [Caulobacter sp. AP07]EJL28024.1 sphingosine/diacylglycerol kinase-like enzyme [Caulobacter sp. AP07]
MAIALMRIGVVRNPRSHANIGRAEETSTPDAVLLVEPATPEALEQDLEAFAQCGVGLLVIDGGDGTIRDVLSLLPRAFGDNPPLIALLPSGKTNVLAIDLGVPRDWTLEDAIAAARSDKAVIKLRAPLEVRWDDGRPSLRGFVFGLGAFVRATSLAQNVHKLGAFHSISVAMSVLGALIGTVMGGARDEWRAGVPLCLAVDDQDKRTADRFIVLATTLKRLPFNLMPFGPPREGMKYLEVDAPPRRLPGAFPALLKGRDSAWQEQYGYRRGDAERLRITTDQPLVVDGDVYDGGCGLTVGLAPTLRFLAS